MHHAFIPKGACWLNLQQARWRRFRKEAFAGQTFADGDEIDQATAVATQKHQTPARPSVQGGLPPPPWRLSCRFVYWF